MVTIILPGYSPHNKEWALEVKKDLKLGHKVVVHEWRHWENSSSSSLSIRYELDKISKEIGEEEVNIIGKSVGARVAVRVLSEIKDKVNKVILCGVASTSDDVKKVYEIALADFPPERIICFQNTRDPFVPYSQAEKLIHSVNPEISVIEKPGSEHHYPYTEDFQNFLLKI